MNTTITGGDVPSAETLEWGGGNERYIALVSATIDAQTPGNILTSDGNALAWRTPIGALPQSGLASFGTASISTAGTFSTTDGLTASGTVSAGNLSTTGTLTAAAATLTSINSLALPTSNHFFLQGQSRTDLVKSAGATNEQFTIPSGSAPIAARIWRSTGASAWLEIAPSAINVTYVIAGTHTVTVEYTATTQAHNVYLYYTTIGGLSG